MHLSSSEEDRQVPFEEGSTKFNQIQAAYEVLSDPRKKAGTIEESMRMGIVVMNWSCCGKR
ncbi:hypothetical protein [Wolbachia endosymbiont of Tetranychus urticae]|uniref:hypothetical protein n=1 Tax=Wolbachia endosymbiont of Tetranychus urticae TaxID=169184 RepID=UPI0039798C42